MRYVNQFFIAAASALAITSVAAPAFAQVPIEFASYQPDSAADGQPGGIVWLRADDGGAPAGLDPSLAVANTPAGGYLFTTAAALAAGPTPVVPHSLGAMDTLFNFHNVPGVTNSDLKAAFTLQASSSAAATCTGPCEEDATVRQGGIQGFFSFVYTGLAPIIVDGHVFGTGANLLSGTFTGASIVGTIGDTNGSFGAADRANRMIFSNVNFTSDLLTFASPSVDQISLTIGAGAFPVLNVTAPGAGLSSYRSAGAGLFASNPLPRTPGVPEPTSWALMILGFGGAGVMLRRRRVNAFA